MGGTEEVTGCSWRRVQQNAIKGRVPNLNAMRRAAAEQMLNGFTHIRITNPRHWSPHAHHVDVGCPVREASVAGIGKGARLSADCLSNSPAKCHSRGETMMLQVTFACGSRPTSGHFEMRDTQVRALTHLQSDVLKEQEVRIGMGNDVLKGVLPMKATPTLLAMPCSASFHHWIGSSAAPAEPPLLVSSIEAFSSIVSRPMRSAMRSSTVRDALQ